MTKKGRECINVTRIKECLDRMGKTQKWLAITMGVKQPSVHDWITGKNKPTADNLKRLSEIFHVSTDYLLGVPDEEPSIEENVEPDKAMQIRERLRRDLSYRLLFDAADKATPDHLRAAAAMLKALGNNDND
jgi:transcriptional regulator with XRE-family HTH domain